MPPRNGGNKNRNSGRRRTKTEESQTTTPCAQPKTFQASTTTSPSRESALPVHNQNKVSPSNVSSPLHSNEGFNSAKNSQAHTGQILDSVDVVNTQQLSKVSPKSTGKDRATVEMGDNRGFSSSTTPPPIILHTSAVTRSMSQQPNLHQAGSPPLTSDELSNQGNPEDTFNSSPSDPWHLTYTELRAMRIEFAQQLQSISTRATSTETNVSTNTSNIKGMAEELHSLRELVDAQQQEIKDLQKTKEELSKIKQEFSNTTKKTISEMNSLLEQQGQQVQSLRTIRKDIQTESRQQKEELQSFKTLHTDIQKEVQQQFKQVNEDIAFKELKDKAFKTCHNIVILGLPENGSYTPFSVAIHFFKTKLKLRNLGVESAYRKGQSPSDDSGYIRPLVVKFYSLYDRNLVWRRRNKIPQSEGSQHIKIQADLPKKLREDVTTLYRVVRAAASLEDYKDASVRDFQIALHGKMYSPDQLERLPAPLRPSSLAIRKTDQTFVFFTKFCPLSNHSPSMFTYQDKVFQNMEQYLAFKKAELSQQPHLIERSLKAEDPVEAKSILTSLRYDHEQEWHSIRENVATEGLRQKFTQNPKLADYLISTQNRRIGEASRNPIWGIGMTLDDENVLDTARWKETGNLLGELLMKIRNELTGPPEQTTHKG